MYVVNTDKNRSYTVFVDDKKIAGDLKPGMVSAYKGKTGEVRFNIYAKREVYTGWADVRKGMIVKIIPVFPSFLGVDLLFEMGTK